MTLVLSIKEKKIHVMHSTLNVAVKTESAQTKACQETTFLSTRSSFRTLFRTSFILEEAQSTFRRFSTTSAGAIASVFLLLT